MTELQNIPCRTPLGKRLGEIRSRIVTGGAPLLDWDAVNRAVDDPTDKVWIEAADRLSEDVGRTSARTGLREN